MDGIVFFQSSQAEPSTDCSDGAGDDCVILHAIQSSGCVLMTSIILSPSNAVLVVLPTVTTAYCLLQMQSQCL